MSKKILYVDDNPTETVALIRKLRFQGYDCVIQKNVTDALNYLEGHHKVIEGVITDIVMPGGEGYPELEPEDSGYFLAEEVLRKFPQIPVICISIHVHEERIKHLKEKGVVYIRKMECSLSEVVRAINIKIKHPIYLLPSIKN